MNFFKIRESFLNKIDFITSRNLMIYFDQPARDGAENLLRPERAGARTIAQDEVASVVYGMPKVAADLGAADQILPSNDIPAHMVRSFIDQLNF
mgnify:CR=1 FL=1